MYEILIEAAFTFIDQIPAIILHLFPEKNSRPQCRSIGAGE